MSILAQPPAATRTGLAAIYCRVSTTGQREEGTSLDTQMAACLDHARGLGYRVDEAHVIREDWPGTTLDRPQLDRLRTLVRDGVYAAVVAYSTDRLSRDPIHLALLAQELDQRGVRLELVTEPVDGSPEGQLLQFVRGWAGKLEHAKIRERTMRGKREAARRGKLPTGSHLYGYQYLKGEGRCEIDPEQAEIVRMVYRWYTEEGLTQGRIAIRLTDLGIPAAGHGYGEKRTGGAQWHTSSIHRMLTNDSYAGQAQAFKWIGVEPKHPDPEKRRRYKNSRKEPRPIEQRIAVPDAIPAIISPETFGAAAEIRARNRDASPRNRQRDYLLVGRVVCAWCRRRYHADWCRKWGYYHCSGAKNTDRAARCRNVRLPMERVEADVWERVQAVLSDPSLIAKELEKRQGEQGASASLRADLELVDGAIARTADRERRLVKLYSFGEIDEDVIGREMGAVQHERERLISERTALLTRLEQAERTIRSLDGLHAYCERVRSRLAAMGPDARRLACEALGIRVTVDPNRPDEAGLPYRVHAIVNADDAGIALQPSGTSECNTSNALLIELPRAPRLTIAEAVA